MLENAMTGIGQSAPESCDQSEWDARISLAAAYRKVAKPGMDDLARELGRQDAGYRN